MRMVQTMRAIDVDALKDDIAVLLERNSGLIDEWLANCIDDVIDEQPTIIVEPKRGRWEETEYSAYDDSYRCSACGEVWEFIEGTPKDNGANYCPNCGAKMLYDDWEEPEINPCRGCTDYDGKGGCISNGGCGAKMDEVEEDGNDRSSSLG